jgi:hypothetical protein
MTRVQVAGMLMRSECLCAAEGTDAGHLPCFFLLLEVRPAETDKLLFVPP